MRHVRRATTAAVVTVAVAGLLGPSAPASNPPVDTAPRNVPAVTAASQADFDGDGYGDFVLPAPRGSVEGRRDAGYVAVAYGAASRRVTTQIITQNSAGVPGRAEGRDEFGGRTAWADFDGDGYTDLLVAAPGEERADVPHRFAEGVLTVVWGGPRGLSDGTVLAGDVTAEDWLYYDAMVTGDFDGDGHQDVATPWLVLYGPITRSGGAARTDQRGLNTGEHPADEDDLERWVPYDLAAGDVDADGVTDLLATASVEYDGEPGDVFLLFFPFRRRRRPG